MPVCVQYCHEIEAKIWACLSRASAVQVPKSQKSKFAAPKSQKSEFDYVSLRCGLFTNPFA